jgi:hypothetical protein
MATDNESSMIRSQGRGFGGDLFAIDYRQILMYREQVQ